MDQSNTMQNLTKNKRPARSGFTLIELMIVIFIISILASLSAYVLAGAVTDAKIAKTKAQVTKLNNLLMERWESYETRQLQLNVPVGTTPAQMALIRLYALRQMMRIEMPDRFEDITKLPNPNPPLNPIAPSPAPISSLQRFYQLRIAGFTNTTNESAECLYLIISSIEDEFGSAIDNFGTSDIGDTDNDGFLEFVDGWGNPIGFIRWPAGYRSAVQKVIMQDGIVPLYDPDPNDPFRADPRFRQANPPFKPYLLAPLIFSAGPDERHDIKLAISSPAFVTANGYYAYDDPYVHENVPQPTNFAPLGTPTGSGYIDNIDNHIGVIQ